MNTDKAKSYIVYAIGEIILVVIGILIALQISNWNDDYKDRQLEQIYYCKLLEDVNQDQVLLDQLKQENKERIQYCNRSIHLLQQKQVERKEIVNAMRESISRIRFNFRPSLSAFDDLKSSGKLAIIKDLSLKRRLLHYYAVQASYGDILDILGDASLSVYLNPTKEFAEVGFQDIDNVQPEIDTSLVDLDKLKPIGYPSQQIRQKLLNESILHLNQNARQKNFYVFMQSEIEEMQKALTVKCDNK
jgi:hypothetical protein